MGLEDVPWSSGGHFNRACLRAANNPVWLQCRGIMTQGELGRKGKTGTDCERPNILV